MRGVNFERANLDGANLTGCIINTESLSYDGGILPATNFHRACLGGIKTNNLSREVVRFIYSGSSTKR